MAPGWWLVPSAIFGAVVWLWIGAWVLGVVG